MSAQGSERCPWAFTHYSCIVGFAKGAERTDSDSVTAKAPSCCSGVGLTDVSRHGFVNYCGWAMGVAASRDHCWRLKAFAAATVGSSCIGHLGFVVICTECFCFSPPF